MAKQQDKAQKLNNRARNAKAGTAEKISNVFIPTRETVLQEVIQTISESATSGDYICHVRVKPTFVGTVNAWLRQNKYIGVLVKTPQEKNTIVIGWFGFAYINLYCGDFKGNKFLKYGEVAFGKLMGYIKSNFDYNNKSKLKLISPMDSEFKKNDEFLEKLGKYVSSIK
jgi:hypothetical protein